MSPPQILTDITVLELSNILAGPRVGMFLAELGAKVIKVENKQTGGDITRQWKLPSELQDSPVSAYYCCANWGKEVHLMDLKSAEDLAQIYAWVREVDIVLCNFKLPSAQRLKVDYESLKSLNSRLIYAQLTAFGESDTRLGFDVALQAETGYIHMTGTPDGPAAKLPVAFMDLLAAHQLKEGILCALLQRERTGEGAYIHTSLLASGIASLANQATNWLMAGQIPSRQGTQHPNIAPYGDLFLTKDKVELVLAVGTDAQFVALMEVLGLEVDEKFSQNTLRVSRRKELISLLQSRVEKRNAKELLLALHQKNIPVGRIRNMEEVFELETAQDMILREVDAEGFERICVRTVAFEIK